MVRRKKRSGHRITAKTQAAFVKWFADTEKKVASKKKGNSINDNT